MQNVLLSALLAGAVSGKVRLVRYLLTVRDGKSLMGKRESVRTLAGSTVATRRDEKSEGK